MEVRQPLSEVPNQRQPRRRLIQTYSRKKAPASKRRIDDQELFGYDENSLEVEFATLSISDGSQPKHLVSKLDDARDIASHVNKIETTRTKQATRNPTCSPSSINRQRASKLEVLAEDLSILAPLLALSQHPVESFTIFGDKIAKSCEIKKIGEGSFAEVFEIKANSSRTLSDSSSKPSSIIKIIPLLHPTSSESSADRVSAVPSVAREINILKHLDILHGFTGFASLRVVKGSWPAAFLHAFYEFQKHNRKRALNVAPDEDFDQNQIYALVEMDNAGTELALIQRPSLFQIYDIFWTTVILLVNAEERFEFEHRDLHLSNICVKSRINNLNASAVASQVTDVDDETLVKMKALPSIKLGLSNLDITIIDYTVSRAKLPEISSSPNSQGHIEYDEMSFASEPIEPTTDMEAALQFATYQKCRCAAKLAQSMYSSTDLLALQNSSQVTVRSESPPTPTSKYARATPVTNVIWLGYLLRVLLRRNAPVPTTASKTFTKATTSTRQRKAKTPQTRKPYIIEPQSLPQYTAGELATTLKPTAITGRKTRSCTATSTSSTSLSLPTPIPVSTTLQQSIFQELCTVDAVINGSPDDGVNPDLNNLSWTEDHISSIPPSAKSLLERAVQKGWIKIEEIEALKDRLERQSDD